MTKQIRASGKLWPVSNGAYELVTKFRRRLGPELAIVPRIVKHTEEKQAHWVLDLWAFGRTFHTIVPRKEEGR